MVFEFWCCLFCGRVVGSEEEGEVEMEIEEEEEEEEGKEKVKMVEVGNIDVAENE